MPTQRQRQMNQDSTVTRRRGRKSTATIHPYAESKSVGIKSEPSKIMPRANDSVMARQMNRFVNNANSCAHRLKVCYDRLKLSLSSRAYASVMMVVLVLSVLLSFFRAGVLIYLQNGSVTNENRNSFATLFWSYFFDWRAQKPANTFFPYAWHHLPKTFAVTFPLLCILWADTMMNFFAQQRNNEDVYEITCIFSVEVISIALDILDILVVLFTSRLLIGPSNWSMPLQRELWAAVMVTPPLFRCLRFVRLCSAWKRGDAKTSVKHNVEIFKPTKHAQKHRRRFDPDSLAHHLLSSSTTHVQPSRIGKAPPQEVTTSIKLQLRLLARLAMVNQEAVLNDFGKPFLSSQVPLVSFAVFQSRSPHMNLFR